MEKYYISKKDAHSLYKMLYEVVKLLDENNIEYWAIGGTLLGAVRCGGIIKWDDDLDLGVPLKYREKLMKILKSHKEFNFIEYNDLLGKIYYKDREKIKGYEWSYPFCDIFFMHIDPKLGCYVHSYKNAKKSWPKETYHMEDFPLIKYKFGAMSVNVPRRVEEAMVRMFGDDWNKVGVIRYDHKNEKKIDKIVFKLEDEHRKPAEPFYGEVEGFIGGGVEGMLRRHRIRYWDWNYRGKKFLAIPIEFKEEVRDLFEVEQIRNWMYLVINWRIRYGKEEVDVLFMDKDVINGKVVYDVDGLVSKYYWPESYFYVEKFGRNDDVKMWYLDK